MNRPAVLFHLVSSISVRHWRRSPGLHALLILIIATGVAAFLAIRLANRAVTSDFERFAAGLSRESLITVTRTDPPLALPDLLAIRDACAPFPIQVLPSNERIAVRFKPQPGPNTPPDPNATLRLVGVDLVASLNLLNTSNSSTDSPHSIPSSLTPEESPVLAAPALFQSLPITGSGSRTLTVLAADAPIEIPVHGAITSNPGSPEPPPNMVVMDILRMASLFSTNNTFDRIDLFAAEDAALQPELIERILRNKDPSLHIQTPEQRGQAAASMTRGLRLNLAILSLLSLLVGGYLVFQALDAAVVRRRPEIAALRSLGVTPDILRDAWLLEAATLGFLGGSLGMIIGRLLGTGAVVAVSQTVHSLYYANATRTVALTSTEAALTLACAIGAALLAGWIPARSAAQTPPAQLLGSVERPPQNVATLLPWTLFLLCSLAALGCSRFHAIHLDDGAHIPFGGYLSALFTLAAAGFAVPAGLPSFAKMLLRCEAQSPFIQLGNSRLRRSGSRHLWAAASLVCALAMMTAMQVLVSSFASSIESWIIHSLKADVFVTNRANQSASAGAQISGPLVEKLRSRADVLHADGFLMHQVGVRGEPDSFRLLGSDFLRSASRQPLQWLGPTPADEILQPHLDGNSEPEFTSAVVSESYTVRFHARIGDSLRCIVGGAPRKLRIVGIHADFSDQFGTVSIPLKTLQRWLATDAVTSVVFTLKTGSDPVSFADKIQKDHPALMVYTNASLRSEVLRLFRQTFAVTHALELIGLAVAIGGLVLTVSTLLGERRHEWATLEVMGTPPSVLTRSAAWETGVLSLFSSLLGSCCGLALGTILIFIINYQTFGWTLLFNIPWATVLSLIASISAIGACTGFLSAHKALKRHTAC